MNNINFELLFIVDIWGFEVIVFIYKVNGMGWLCAGFGGFQIAC